MYYKTLIDGGLVKIMTSRFDYDEGSMLILKRIVVLFRRDIELGDHLTKQNLPSSGPAIEEKDIF